MNASQLHNKTVRPGSLNGYSYYYSNRQAPQATAVASKAASRPKPFKLIAVLLVVAIALITFNVMRSSSANNSSNTAKTTNAVVATKPSPKKAAPAVVTPAPVASNKCSDNTLDKLILVDISDRHLWACEGAKVVYDSNVITGMEAHASTLTPPGTYHIYGKVKDTTLTGSDETGSWKDPVSYWMPFLTNQYGTYGFHDATWRAESAFGNIDPNSSDASHGCVELPLATSGWIYNWAPVGTTLTITS